MNSTAVTEAHLAGAGRVPAPAGRRSARVAAVTTAVGSAWHGAMALAHAGTALAAVMLPMAAVCLFCAVHLWRGPTDRRAWAGVVAMSAGMLGAHVVVLTASGSGGHMHHGPGTSSTLAWLTGPDMMLAVPLVNLLITGAAAYRTYRAVRLATG